jgi:hypothetical protein
MNIQDVLWTGAGRCLPGVAAAVGLYRLHAKGRTEPLDMPCIGAVPAPMRQVPSDRAVFWVAVVGGVVAGLCGY